jgi:hypothetical protein
VLLFCLVKKSVKICTEMQHLFFEAFLPLVPLWYTPAMVIRCATPDCDWGHPMPSISSWDESDTDKCRDAFRQHCVERHQLAEYDTQSLIWLDVEHWTMRSMKEQCYERMTKR